MHAADDRREVMLAMGLEADVAQHDDLVIAAGLLEGALEVFARIVVVAGEPFLVGARHPRRRGAQALAVRIVAGPADQGADRALGLGARRPGRPGGFGTRTFGTGHFSHSDVSGGNSYTNQVNGTKLTGRNREVRSDVNKASTLPPIALEPHCRRQGMRNTHGPNCPRHIDKPGLSAAAP